MNRFTALCTALAIAASMPHAASADDFTWTGSTLITTGVANWDSTSINPIGGPDFNNWIPGGTLVPNADDNVFFNDSANHFIVDLNGNRTILNANFSGATAYTLDNNTLTLLEGGFDVGAAAVTHTINSDVNLGSNGTWAVGADATLNVVGIVGETGGSFGLTKTGTGELRLSGLQNYTGDVDVQDGLLTLNGNEILLSTAVLMIQTNGTVDLPNSNSTQTLAGLSGDGSLQLTGTDSRVVLDQAGDTTFNGVISGDGGLIKQGAGNLVLSSTSTYAGATQINAGKTFLQGTDRLPTATDVTIGSGARLTLQTQNSSQTIGSLSGDGQLEISASNSDFRVGLNNTDTTFNGNIFGDGALAKIGDGTLTLTGNNTHGENTSIEGGTLAVQSKDNLGAAGSTVTIINDATLKALADLTFDTHTLDIDHGTLNGQGPNATRGYNLTLEGTAAIDVDADGLIDLRGGSGIDGSPTGRKGGTFAMTGGTFELRAGGELQSRGGPGGTRALPGNGDPGVGGTVSLAGGVSNLAGRINLSGYGGSAVNSGTNAGMVEISGSAQVTLTGVVNLRGGNNSYPPGVGGDAGDFSVLGGTLVVDDPAARIDLRGGVAGGTPKGSRGRLRILGGTTTFNAGIVRGFGDADTAAPIDMIGSIVNVNGGELVLTDDTALTAGAELNLFDGSVKATTIDLTDGSINFTGGELTVDQFNGDLLQQGGTLAAGNSPGITNIDGNYELAGGQLKVEFLGSITPGTDFDQYNVTGNVDLTGGSLQVDQLAPFLPSSNFQMIFMTIDGTRTGTFTGLAQWDQVGAYSGFDLFIDYTAGDGNDIALTSVPEPTSLALLGMGGAALLVRRGRRASRSWSW